MLQFLRELYCKHFGHRCEVEDFVSADRDEYGRIIDINGGGCEWYCLRCGAGGRHWW